MLIVLNDSCFDFLLVDEATQVKEPTLLCALAAGGGGGMRSLVMIGDPKQLGPCVRVGGPSNKSFRKAIRFFIKSQSG